MSYDLRFAVKGIDEKMYVVFTPEYDSPTYNIGEMFRKAMDWDFIQGEWYKVEDVLPNIERGIHELTFNSRAYKKYEPDNGWGSVGSALRCLNGLMRELQEHINGGCDWNEYSLDNLYICW